MPGNSHVNGEETETKVSYWKTSRKYPQPQTGPLLRAAKRIPRNSESTPGTSLAPGKKKQVDVSLELGHYRRAWDNDNLKMI